MALTNNTFCWNGIVSTDVDKTLAFFPEVLGWKVQKMDMGGEEATMFANGDKPLAHVRGPQMDGEASWWNNYLRVEDVDAAIQAVTKNGGEVVVPGTDIPPGRFATVKTPSGAHFSLFREANSDDQDRELGVGTIHWTELHSTDLDEDLAFIKAGLGLPTSEMPMPDGPYNLINADGKTRAGAMTQKHDGAPSMWLAWIEVANVDDTVGRAENNGGKVLVPAFEVPGIGKMAIASDPAGVAFGVITPPPAS